MTDVAVVGAGLAGLACAVDLVSAGRDVAVLEAGDAPGGRVRSDRVDGFTLDRGFQVYLTAYPEGRQYLDYGELDLRHFAPGALVRAGASFHRVGDPLRRPGDLFATVRSPVGTVADKLRVAALALQLRRKSQEELLSGPDTSTRAYLKERGFSERMVARLLGPLFAGIQLDPDLETSSLVFRFVFAMLAAGDAAVPAAGMQAIPDQLAARLPAGSLRCGERVERVEGRSLALAGGDELAAGAVVVATGADEASRLLGVADPGWAGVSCVYFAADEPPVPGPWLMLNGEGDGGPVNNLAVMSEVAPEYAPAGRALIAAQVLGVAPGPERPVRDQLRQWFGGVVDTWEHLRTDTISKAQPRQLPPFGAGLPASLGNGRFLAGDHRATASINGALASGRRAAAAVLAAG